MNTNVSSERVEKLGVSATIYAPKNESKGFTVAYHVRGELVRKVRTSYEDAKELVPAVVDQKGNSELDIHMPASHAGDYRSEAGQPPAESRLQPGRLYGDQSRFEWRVC